MTEPTRCLPAGHDKPRVLVDRHVDDCPSPAECRGCQPCTLNHCLSCGYRHDTHVCPACLADVRETLHEISRLCEALPGEANARGIDSEAMNLLGPAADPEARGHLEASYRAGRLPEGWLETGKHGKHCPLLVNEACTGCSGDELHPLIICGKWMGNYLEAFDHDEPARVTVPGALSYLIRNLDHIATEDDIPFKQFRDELTACLNHLEQVLRDGDQVEPGSPCLVCKKPLLRVYRGNELPWKHRDGSQPLAADDCWACARCRETRSDGEYLQARKDELLSKADLLGADDMSARTGVPASTIRRWANVRRIKGIEHPPLLRSVGRNGLGWKIYRVTEVERIKETGGDTRGSNRKPDDPDTVSNEGAA